MLTIVAFLQPLVLVVECPFLYTHARTHTHPKKQSRPSAVSEESIVKEDGEETDGETEFLASVLDIGNNDPSTQQGELSDDYLMGLEDLTDPLTQLNEVSGRLRGSGTFLEKVTSYLENEQLPFEHADIWVPSVANTVNSNGKPGGLQLFHAGCATRSDIDSGIAFRMNEYGMYSKNFSFAPGVGLPGRVYVSGQPSWEGSVDEADPTYFERAGGAKVYGVRCALGIPLHTVNIGRIVLALYSTQNIPENKQLSSKFVADFAKWVPEPKWKLVIDFGSSTDPSMQQQQQHYQQQSRGSSSPFVTKFTGTETISQGHLQTEALVTTGGSHMQQQQHQRHQLMVSSCCRAASCR